MKVYVHEEESRDPVVEELPNGAKLSGLTKTRGEEAEVWLEGGEEPLSAELTVLEAGLEDRAHVFVGRPTKVNVTVNYNGVAEEREFAPSQTVKHVLQWAVGHQGFDLDRTERVKHALFPCGTEEEALDPAIHIGSLASEGEVCFNLAPKHRFEGDGS